MRSRVDTRSKILTLPAAEALAPPLILVTGYFDVLRGWHLIELQQLRERARGAKVLVALLAAPGELMDSRSRAELVAALRMVDYVVTADHGELDAFIQRLRPVELARLDAAELGRRKQLIEDVQRRQHQ
jgi:glycerol-3-phosphate cytidylyltransferase-like family protein